MQDDRVRLCTVAEIPTGSGLRVSRLGKESVAVFKVGDEIVVLDDACTHNGASLSRYGEVQADVLECTWHGCRFDIHTGEALGGPCGKPLGVHSSIVLDGVVFLLA